MTRMSRSLDGVLREELLCVVMASTFQLSANISMLFAELAFLDRIGAAARAGFHAVECQFPYAHAAQDIALRVADHGLVMNGINTPMGDPQKNEFGCAALPGRQAKFRADFETALAYADRLRAGTIHCMSGAPQPDELSKARETFLGNMRWASEQARSTEVTLVVEPLNSRDRPGYFVSRSDDVVALLRELDCENVKLLFDVYHIQIMEGDLIRRMERHWPYIGHVQIAGVPERHEPDTGEVAFEGIIRALTACGWSGYVGAEYNPRGDTMAGLGWAKPWLNA
jgi:hydroxypyruvate isomerase